MERLSLTDFQKAQAQHPRQRCVVGSVSEIIGETGDDLPLLFHVPIMSGSDFKAPPTDGQAKATTLECLKT